MDKKLLCGTAKRDITPANHFLGKIYGLQSVLYAGVIDSLSLRVIAFSDNENKALIVGFDLDKAPLAADWIPLLEEKTGIPAANITYLGTHTHSAPVTTERVREPKKNLTAEMIAAMHEYEQFVLDALLSAVDEALAGLQPAKIGFGWGESYINVNRNAEFIYEKDGKTYPYVSQGPNNKAPVDRGVFVFKVEDANGNSLAFFVNYALHCCVMFLNRYNDQGNMGISGDIAGAVSRMIEDRYPGSVAIWSSGAAGDVNPIIANEVFYPDPENGARKMYLMPDYQVIHQLMISLAARHFEDIVETIRGINNMTDFTEIAGALEWSETARIEVAPDGAETIDPKGYRIRLQLLRIGEIALLGIGGELYSSFGKLIRAHAPLANTVVINHNASLIDDAGYIVDDETFARIQRETPVKGGVPGGQSKSVAGQVGPSLLKHTQSMFRQVL